MYFFAKMAAIQAHVQTIQGALELSPHPSLKSV